MVISTTKQVLFQLQPKGIITTILYGGYRTALGGSFDTAKWWLYLTKMGLYLLIM